MKVDNEYISRADALAMIKYSKNIEEGIKSLPSIRIIRCKNCGYAIETVTNNCVICSRTNERKNDNEFCSNGI